ncbi:MAG: RNA polymerase factor sigma-54 [Deltaproteobacteria bacterium]|nr:RNA polymerase factor sigma-54 [Deltaproteobacteria bacterium]
MANLKQTLKLGQQLVMTPQLQQAIKLLQLSRLELEKVVSSELLENPLLEEDVQSLEAKDLPKEEKKTLVEGKDSFDWESYVESYNASSGSLPYQKKNQDEVPVYENLTSKAQTLTDHLNWQLKLSEFSHEEVEIGAFIIGNLNEDGYLIMGVEEIAQKENWDLDKVKRVLSRIQSFDPVGVASTSLKECLLKQLDYFEIGDEKVKRVVQDHLQDLENRNFSTISKALNISQEGVIDIVKLIHQLEPKPGRSFSTTDTHYITPDVYIYKVADEYVIVLNEDGLPKLKISSFYKNLLKTDESSTLTKDYIQDKLRSAIWLIRSIHQRQRTIYKVTESIVKHQKEFFDKGLQHLKPMVLKDIAADIGMHESTVSRVTTNKYMHTPRGIFELKYFFNTSVSRDEGADIASESVKHMIKEIVESEPPKKPYSDQRIVEILKSKNINIARRTVAKYRDMLKILPSSKRKKMF